MDKVAVKIKDKEDRAKGLETYLNDLKASKMKLT